MYDAKVTIKDLSRTMSGEWVLSLIVQGNILAIIDSLKDKALRCMLKPWREKRSLDANAYCWSLITEMANVLRTDKDSVYLKMLKRYGQGGVVKVRKEDEHEILRCMDYYEPHEKLYTDTDKYYRTWVGSSRYDTREMAIFIDGIISECKELDIETATPEELARFKEEPR